MSPVNETDDSGRPRVHRRRTSRSAASIRCRSRSSTSATTGRPGRWSTRARTSSTASRTRTTTWGGNGHPRRRSPAGAVAVPGRPAVHRRRPPVLELHRRQPGRRPDSQVLLYRGMRTRMERLAPFLEWDIEAVLRRRRRPRLRDRRRVRGDRPAAVLGVIRRRALPAHDGDRRHGRLLGRDEAVRRPAERADHRHLDEGLPVAVHAARAAAGGPEGPPQVRRGRVRRAGGRARPLPRHVGRDVLQRRPGVGVHGGGGRHRRRTASASSARPGTPTSCCRARRRSGSA